MSCCENLLEGGLFNEQGVDESTLILTETDEFLRLQAHLIWFAWYAGISHQLVKGFNEDKRAQDHRLWMNSVYSLLAQVLHNNEFVEEEASRLSASESESCLKWYSSLNTFGMALRYKYERAFQSQSRLPRPSKASWVLHENAVFKGLRYCHNVEKNIAIMASISKPGVHRNFVIDKVYSC